MFLPVYLFVLFIGRVIIRYRKHPVLQGFVKGATAAAGAIAGAAVLLTAGAVRDLPTAAIGLISLGLLWRFKVPEPILIGVAALIGGGALSRLAHAAVGAG